MKIWINQKIIKAHINIITKDMPYVSLLMCLVFLASTIGLRLSEPTNLDFYWLSLWVGFLSLGILHQIKDAHFSDFLFCIAHYLCSGKKERDLEISQIKQSLPKIEKKETVLLKEP